MANDVSSSGAKAEIKTYERVFNLVGWLGFLFIIPLVLASFGLFSVQQWLETNLGLWGSVGFLLLYFYVFQVLRIFFGSGRSIHPLLVGGVTSFLIISAVLPFGFMQWWFNLLSPTLIFAMRPLSFVMALLSMILGYVLSYQQRVHPLITILIVVLLPIGLSIGFNYLGIHDALMVVLSKP